MSTTQPLASTGTLELHPAEPVMSAALQAQLDHEFRDYNQADIERECRLLVECSAKAAIELGKRLLVLKDATKHGEWLPTLKRIGIEPHTSSKLMKMTVRLLNQQGGMHLIEVVNSKSQLIELMVLENDELTALALGDTVRGIHINTLPKVSVFKLRRALRRSVATLSESKTNQIEQVVDRMTVNAAGLPSDQAVMGGDYKGETGLAFDEANQTAPQPSSKRAMSPDHEDDTPTNRPSLSRRKAYARQLCRVIACHATDEETRLLTRALEDVSAAILSRRYCPGLNAASYQAYAELGLQGGAQ